MGRGKIDQKIVKHKHLSDHFFKKHAIPCGNKWNSEIKKW
jgi:hypothetical protein